MNKKLYKVSLYLGIVSIAFSIIECFLYLIIIGILLGIGAIVTGILSIKSEKKNYSFAGIVLGTAGVLLGCVWLYLLLIMK